MKNFKIGKKLLITFGTIIMLFCVSVAVSIFSMQSIGNNFTTFYEGPFPVTQQAADIQIRIQSFAKYVGYSMMTDDPQKTQQFIQGAQDELEKMRGLTATLKQTFLGDKALVERYEKVMNDMVADRDQVMAMALVNQNQEATQIYFDKVQPLLIEALGYLGEISDESIDMAAGNYGDSMSQKNAVFILLLAISLITLAVTIFLAIYITRSLTRPISEIENAAKEMTEGNLNVSIAYESKDELGSMADRIRQLTDTLQAIITEEDYLLGQMAEGNFDVHTQIEERYVGDFQSILTSMRRINVNLSNTIAQINQASDQVAAGSDQVSSGAQALSQGATEQASSVEELAATINEISQKVKDTADNAFEARKQTMQAQTETSTCNQQMQEMIEAMSEISQKSSEIGKIIKTIEDIAFQTNILALNAAVEAARAGSAGKGFAVVADEVRNLASKSAEASNNTAALIEGSIQAVNKGTQIANDTAESLVKVVESSQNAAALVDRIADAAADQAEAVNQVTQGVDQISGVVQTNSATAEESAAASEELSGQAQLLKNLVGRFTIRLTDGGDRL